MVVHTVTRTLAAAAALASLVACGTATSGGDPQRVDVVVGFYPLQYVTERIGGDAVRVTNLAKPGAEPHDLELNPRQVGQVTEAELIVYLNGFQPALDEAVAQSGEDRAFDAATVEPLLDAASGGGKDPHLWLDPTRLASLGERLAERLGRVDPDRAGDYTTRAQRLRADLAALDQEFTQGLRSCQRREIVVSHTAFGYLAQRYRLEQIGISGLTPENEPAPRRLAEVARQARAHDATTIFFETLVSPKVAETIAREVGAGTAVLDPVEGPPSGSGNDYISAMRSNLATLRTALGCS